jgi:hypothetical protein
MNTINKKATNYLINNSKLSTKTIQKKLEAPDNHPRKHSLLNNSQPIVSRET